jgi:hypothetical protein
LQQYNTAHKTGLAVDKDKQCEKNITTATLATTAGKLSTLINNPEIDMADRKQLSRAQEYVASGGEFHNKDLQMAYQAHAAPLAEASPLRKGSGATEVPTLDSYSPDALATLSPIQLLKHWKVEPLAFKAIGKEQKAGLKRNPNFRKLQKLAGWENVEETTWGASGNGNALQALTSALIIDQRQSHDHHAPAAGSSGIHTP